MDLELTGTRMRFVMAAAEGKVGLKLRSAHFAPLWDKAASLRDCPTVALPGCRQLSLALAADIPQRFTAVTPAMAKRVRPALA